jgi:hypothetical protein
MSIEIRTTEADQVRAITFTIDPLERDQIAVVRQVVLYAALCLEPDEDGQCDADQAIHILEGCVDMLRELAESSKGDA